MPEICQAPMVRMKLVPGMCFLFNQSTPVEVELCSMELKDTRCSMLFEPDRLYKTRVRYNTTQSKFTLECKCSKDHSQVHLRAL